MSRNKSSTSASVIEYLQWPSIPEKKGSALPSILDQLEESQWWSQEKLLSHQMLQVRELIDYSIKYIPFYQDRFGPDLLTDLNNFSLDHYRKLPILTRQELVKAGSTIISPRPPISHGKALRGRTTGSSGRPLEYSGTQLTQLFWQAITIREHLWHQRHFEGKLVVIRDGVKNNVYDSWGPPLNLLYATGPSATLNIKTDIHEQIEWLANQNPDYLLSFPSNIRGIAKILHKENISLNNMKQIRTVGEAFGPDLRELVKNTFNAKLVDLYSTCETGYVALQCPEHDHYHIQSEGALVEIIDSNGKPCGSGETGRVVVTDLHNFAMPLIRYDLQDYATVGEQCPCGRGLPVITNINGRERNLIKLPNGKTYWPLFGYRKWMDLAPIEQIQVRQTDLTNVEISLVMPRKLTESEQRQFESILTDSLGYAFNISYNYVDDIPSGPGGKFEEFISDL